jgi:hypothetical protein
VDAKERSIRQRLKDDFEHYASRCLRIRTKSGNVLPFRLNQAQRFIQGRLEEQIRKTGRVRAIILKGRQQGCSTYVEGRYYWKTTHRRGVRTYILAHEEEKAYIQGEKVPVKVAGLEAHLNSLPKEMKEIYQSLKGFYQNNKSNVDRALTDNEELPYCGGITIIWTPGHTPGHICLYLKQYKLLIAGDALYANEGSLVLPPQSINFDMDLSIRSLKKLTKYDIIH